MLSSRIEGPAGTARLLQLDSEVLPLFSNYVRTPLALSTGQLVVPFVSLAIAADHAVAKWFRHSKRPSASELHADLVLASRASTDADWYVVLRVFADDPPVAFSVCLSRISGLLTDAEHAGLVAITAPDEHGKHNMKLALPVRIDVNLLATMRARHQEMLAVG